MTKLRQQHPDVKHTDLMVMAGKRWNEMLPAEKKPYDDMNAQDKLRQEKQQKSLDEKGYFLLEDGSKSNDEKNLPPHKRQLSKAKQSLPSDQEEPKRKSLKKATVAK